jgi:hypothetical protein
VGKRKDFGCTPEKAFREVASLKLNPEETPQQTAHANGGDDTDRQELELKNFTQLI